VFLSLRNYCKRLIVMESNQNCQLIQEEGRSVGGRGVNLFMCGNGARKLLRSLGINSKESIPPAYVAYAGIF
jgi:hypothetical protein